uniref:ADAMTS like 5 n=1 Tax=Cairina moschata TaxID=8855 RepID=A0A8C3C789_CAIMO
MEAPHPAPPGPSCTGCLASPPSHLLLHRLGVPVGCRVVVAPLGGPAAGTWGTTRAAAGPQSEGLRVSAPAGTGGRGGCCSWHGSAWAAASAPCRSPPEEPCTGDPRQYRLCQLQGCPGGSVPFRAMQCSLYDDKPIPGTQARYRWVPFYGAPNACDLNCLAVGHNFYYTFGRVLDGTRCGPDSPELCVGGRCLSVGCDGILGSGARPHACGRCGGGQDGCLVVHRLFQGTEPPSGYFGYMNVTKIPAGATNIRVTDKSRNYLALMRSDGRYVLNGDWSIAWPGPYEAAGTRLLYARSPDGTESLEAAGPTDEDLHVLVLLQEPNPGIEYEFWLPRGHPQPPDTSPLRQPQPRGAGSPPPAELPAPTPPPRTQGHSTEPLPPRAPPGRSGAATGACTPPVPSCTHGCCCGEGPGEPGGGLNAQSAAFSLCPYGTRPP